MPKSKAASKEGEPARRTIEGAKLKPVRTVRRELTGPDGRRVQVDVPVYPPFRLKNAEEREAS